MMNSEQTRIGVDIGGTFTDVVLEAGSKLFSAKRLTTHQAPEEAVIQGVLEVIEKSGSHTSQLNTIIHGTTLATNALIEKRGAKTALITTDGFRDVIEMRSENRFEQYDLNLVLPKPLIQRKDRYTIKERVSAKGDVLLQLDEAEVEALTIQLKNHAYESIAIGLIHSYANSDHERLIRKIILNTCPDMLVSISSEVSPQMRELERFNTVCANAYVKPLMRSYLGRMKKKLQQLEMDCPIYMMHSGGGIMSLEDAAEFPVRLVESGPAGGAIFAADFARRHNLNKVLSFDMGGTTAKICLIKDHIPKTSSTFEVAREYRFKKGSGMNISIPVIDMVEIGAGGGSIAHVDSMKQIRVGPESAGSEPGPACYQQGGELPTVTDSDLLLGKLDPNNFAGGSIQLEPERSKEAMSNHLDSALNMDHRLSAFGVTEVVDENMANAARVHAVENGEDLSEYTAIAFGGAAPLHAARLCEKLGIRKLMIPPGAGVGSAIGFLRAPFSFEAAKSDFMPLSTFNNHHIQSLIHELSAEAEGFVRSCGIEGQLNQDIKAFMRYRGQGWEIPVHINPTDIEMLDGALLQRHYEEAYRLLFGRSVEGLEIEITNWSVIVSTPDKPVETIKAIENTTALSNSETRPVFDTRSQEMTPHSVFDRNTLLPGHSLDGPAVITESETTIIVPSGYSVQISTDHCVALLQNQGAS